MLARTVLRRAGQQASRFQKPSSVKRISRGIYDSTDEKGGRVFARQQGRLAEAVAGMGKADSGRGSVGFGALGADFAFEHQPIGEICLSGLDQDGAGPGPNAVDAVDTPQVVEVGLGKDPGGAQL